jgi:hypothetical protein
LEDSLKDTSTNYITEKRNKEKVDKILYDAGESIKLMLKVYMFNILKESKIREFEKKILYIELSRYEIRKQ